MIVANMQDASPYFRKARDQSPKDYWESLGVEYSFVLEMAKSTKLAATMLGSDISEPFVTACMQIGATLVAAANDRAVV